jgi:lipopolysaccharide biosynthesis glycosyltransferase
MVDKISIALAADNNYAMPLGVTICSIMENISSQYEVDFYIIDGGISNKNLNKIKVSTLKKNCSLIFIPRPCRLPQNIKAIKDASNYQSYITAVAYYRLFLPDLLPQNLAKVIYLDSDLVVQSDISKLWEENIDENYILAVKSMWAGPTASHFNSGVLVINIEKWRKEKLSLKAIEFLQKNNYSYFDQEVLNAICIGKWQELDPRWNVLKGILECSSWRDSPFSAEEYQRVISDPYIIHYVSSAKPWNAPANKVPWSEVFFYYLDMTAWSGWRFTFWRRLQQRLARDLKKLSHFSF